jgi:hypothetical protein
MEQDSQPKVEGTSVKLFAQMFFLFLVDHVLRKYLGLSNASAFIISATIVFLPAYWVSPKPPISFPRYAAAIESMFVALVLVFTIPDLLRTYMPIQLACGLPLLLLSSSLYYPVVKLAPNPVRKVRFVEWALACLVLTLIVAAAATVLVTDRATSPTLKGSNVSAGGARLTANAQSPTQACPTLIRNPRAPQSKSWHALRFNI